MDKNGRERVQYEYFVYATPRYVGDPIDESYEVHKVMLTYLDNGRPSYIIVFRRDWKKMLAQKRLNFPDLDGQTPEALPNAVAPQSAKSNAAKSEQSQ